MGYRRRGYTDGGEVTRDDGRKGQKRGEVIGKGGVSG
jgi:hypothetical protein